MSIKAAFTRNFEHGYITSSIPDKREPEFGLILEDMADHQTIYNAFASHPNIQILEHEVPEERCLVSFAEDTVDNDGHPTALMRQLGLERRRRVSLYPENASYRRFDISFKDAKKTSMRREWENAANCLQSGEPEIFAMLCRDMPQASIIDPRSFRISSIPICARTSYTLIHVLPEEKAAIKYEICNDSCVYTTPHADRVLGYRKEVEAEAKAILVKNPHDQSPARKNELLDLSINELESYLTLQDFKGGAAPANISKVCYGNELVAASYEREMSENSGVKNGYEWALLQNVRAWEYTFPGRKDALVRLCATIPSPRLLTPHTDTSLLKKFFPKQFSETYPSLEHSW